MEVTRISPCKLTGVINPSDVALNIRDNTVLVSIIHTNNETVRGKKSEKHIEINSVKEFTHIRSLQCRVWTKLWKQSRASTLRFLFTPMRLKVQLKFGDSLVSINV